MFRVLVDFIEREKVMLTVLILLIMALVTFFGGYYYIFGRDINKSILVAIILPSCVVFCLSVIVDPCFHSVLELETDDDDEPLDSNNEFLSPDSELFRMITEAEETEKEKKGD